MLPMRAKIHDCPRCGNAARLEKRPFSDQALAALVTWGDMDRSLVGQAICEECYTEMRDILIERSEDIKKIDPKTLTKAS
jgi:bacterioferritin-associated ferredoxin